MPHDTIISLTIPATDIATLDIFHPCRCPVAKALKNQGFNVSVGATYIDFYPFERWEETALSAIEGTILVPPQPFPFHVPLTCTYLDIFRTMQETNTYQDVKLNVRVAETVLAYDYKVDV